MAWRSWWRTGRYSSRMLDRIWALRVMGVRGWGVEGCFIPEWKPLPWSSQRIELVARWTTDHTTTWVRISAWAYLKGVSSFTSLHYLWRSLDPIRPRRGPWKSRRQGYFGSVILYGSRYERWEESDTVSAAQNIIFDMICFVSSPVIIMMLRGEHIKTINTRILDITVCSITSI